MRRDRAGAGTAAERLVERGFARLGLGLLIAGLARRFCMSMLPGMCDALAMATRATTIRVNDRFAISPVGGVSYR